MAQSMKIFSINVGNKVDFDLANAYQMGNYDIKPEQGA